MEQIDNYLEHRNQVTTTEEGMEQCNQDIGIAQDGRRQHYDAQIDRVNVCSMLLYKSLILLLVTLVLFHARTDSVWLE